MSLPLVSIVTPSFNQAEFIEETIRSVKNQDYPNIEHIIVDGCSTDGTVDILKKYPHLIWISEPDKGQSDAINKGFRMAKGEILGWINSDDTYFPDTLKTVCEYFILHQDVDMVYGDFNEIDKEGKLIREITPGPFNLVILILIGNCIPQPTVFLRRRVLEKVGDLNIQLRHAMDYEYWIRVSLSGCRIDHIPKKLANFRLHKDSKTVKEKNFQAREAEEVQRKYLRYIKKERVKIKNLDERSRVIIYGTGSLGKKIYTLLLEKGFDVIGFMDSDEKMWNNECLGKKILSFDEVKSLKYDAILICSMFIEEIKNVLKERCLHEKALIPVFEYL